MNKFDELVNKRERAAENGVILNTISVLRALALAGKDYRF